MLFELTEVYRLPEPIEQVGAWLFRVARNRIIDLFRKHKTEPLPAGEDDDVGLDSLLPSLHAGTEDTYVRSMLMKELHAALEELPDEQREVFVAHELEGRSFEDMSLESGVSVNTLLPRKRYAVLQLRSRLKEMHEMFRA